MGLCTYEIMHGEKVTAQVDAHGRCRILEPAFLPYSLYLEEEEDIDTMVNNITNFYYWCAARILTLDRKYAKEILNSIGANQAVTDKERAQISLAYHCLSLTDIFWVRKKGENCSWKEINLYDNHLDNAFVDVSLRGRQMTVENKSLVRDLSTNGCFPKAWIRRDNGFWLLKGGEERDVEGEVLASKICRRFPCRQVAYELEEFQGQKVSASQIMTTQEYSIVSREAFEIYACNQGIDLQEYILNLDGYAYDMMNLLDYLVGNTDRHWGNWGFLVDNRTNQPVCLHPLMDFNQSFHAYENLKGANCQTVFPRILTQQEAAMEAVKRRGLPKYMEISESWFEGWEAEYGMFRRRLQVLEHSGI